MSTRATDDHLEQSIAIIGMNCRFPDAGDTTQFWENLKNGVESVRAFSREEILAAGVDPRALGHPSHVNAGVVLEDVELFDAEFFGFSPRDAEILDPQQRIFLECAWAALEDAGYNPHSTGALVGVFAGADMSQYLFNLYANPAVVESAGLFQISIANDKDHLTTRTAYKLNLKGPAVTVQTACSTSLVAVCQACQSLLNYQCDVALAGGSALSLPQKTGYFYQPGGIASPDGHCRAFDARAQGTIAGSGVGLVVLKRLEEALADGDSIHAIIRGFAVNNDGAVKVGYTAPSVEGQAEVIATALAMANVEPETVTYVEAHGTGTAMGDPIEVAALTQVFRASTDRTAFCGIGSVKTNFGHLNSAAGVAGLIKAVLALEHEMLPPSLNFERPNPQIDFANSPFYVVDRLREWPRGESPRRAGVSSFGIGGTNAHVVLEEAPPRPDPAPSRPWQLVTLSHRSPAGLERATRNLIDHLERHPDLDAADVAYSLQVGRQAFASRRAVLCPRTGGAGLPQALAGGLWVGEGAVSWVGEGAVSWVGEGAVSWVGEGSALAYPGSANPRVVFMFSGQGSQYPDMGRELYRTEPAFREQVELCAGLLAPHLGLDLREILYPSSEQREAAAERLGQTALTQPALFVVEYALTQLWAEWGIRPQAMVGHSIGEYVAACLAGVLSLPDALALVAARGRLMQQMPRGAMLAVSLPEEELAALLDGRLSLAVVNSPIQSVVAGPVEEIDAFAARLEQRGVLVRRLRTSHAFHSAMMEPVVAPFADFVRRFPLRPPRIPFLSDITGSWITDEQATDPDYWAGHLRAPVRFAACVGELAREPGAILLEVGPGQVLSALAQSHPAVQANRQVTLHSLPRPQEREADLTTMLAALGRLWVAGVAVDWSGFYAHEQRRRVPLPAYPFERQRYWVERPGVTAAVQEGRAQQGEPQPRAALDDWFYAPVWRPAPAGTRSRPPRPGEPWLVFVGGDERGERFVAALEARGAEVVAVRAGERWAEIGPDRFSLDPGRPEGYAALLKSLKARGKAPTRIVHLWSLSGDGGEPSATGGRLERLPAMEDRCFYSVLFLAQALAEQPGAALIDLRVVTDGLYDVGGGERVAAEKGLIEGVTRVIAQEFPNISAQVVDVGPADSPDASPLLDACEREVEESPVALRGGERLIRRYERTRLDAPKGVPPRLRAGGVYLITGGLGAVGLALARSLAARVQAKLVLVSRSGLPEQSRSGDANDRTAATIEEVRALEALGAEVLVARGDVTDPAQMRAVVGAARDRFGAIHGVIHAAGVPGGGIIPLKSREQAAAVLAPKVRGTLVLDEVLREERLDFFVVCSSLGALLGGVGQVDYCAANCFLDAFASERREAGSPFTVSINWDTWAEAGMAVETQLPEALRQVREESLKRGLRSEEGRQVFERVLAADLTRVTVSTVDLAGRIEEMRPRPAPEAPPVPRPAVQHRRPELATPYVAPRDGTERAIVAVWTELLGIEGIGVDDDFLALGGHSLLAVQLLSRLNERFGTELSVARFFETPTVGGLARLIAGEGEDGRESPRAPQPALVRLSREQFRRTLPPKEPRPSGPEGDGG